MDFKDILKQLSERIEKLRDNLQTEEATKNALIMPFIQAMGYDVFNPLEVIPEFTCDIGTKKGEKIDYAIMRDNEPIILIECKHWRDTLTLADNQLLRYFHVSSAKFGMLTNGIIYRFYTDLDQANKMDEKPFLEVNMLDLRDNQIEELKQFHKSYFDVDKILSTASELKYMKELKDLILAEMNEPSEQFVRMLAKQVYDGIITAKIFEQFKDLTQKSFKSVINDLITARFKTVMDKSKEVAASEEQSQEQDDSNEPLVVTTEAEMEAYMIVKGILRKYINIDRIASRDTQSYFSVLLDDNNRKPICRFYFNTANKYLATFEEGKKEVKTLLNSLDDLFMHEKSIAKSLALYVDTEESALIVKSKE